jgi:hypothetical protein
MGQVPLWSLKLSFIFVRLPVWFLFEICTYVFTPVRIPRLIKVLRYHY